MRTFWTEEEIKFLQDNYANMLTSDISKILNRPKGGVYGKANSIGLKKSQEYIIQLLKFEGIKLKKYNNETSFKKNHKPHNKGRKMSSELYEKCKKTFFKKGNKPPNTKNVGDERSVDGYTYVKIADSNWQLKHRVVYENVNGPIPSDSIVIFKDKNIRNFDIDNLLMITKLENMMRNTIHNYPEPLQQLIKLNNKLKNKINEKQN